MPVSKRRPQIVELLNIAVAQQSKINTANAEILERPATIWINTSSIANDLRTTRNSANEGNPHGGNLHNLIPVFHGDVKKRLFAFVRGAYIRASRLAEKIVISRAFQLVRFLCIWPLAFVVLSYQLAHVSELDWSPPTGPLAALDAFINAWFFVECVLRLTGAYMRQKIDEAFNREVTWLEKVARSGIRVLILTIICIGCGVSYAGLWFRSIRVIFVGFSVVELFPHITVLMSGVTHGLRSITFTVLLLFILILAWASMGHYYFSENDPFHFGSYALSALTFFQLSTFENWSTIYYTNYGGCNSFPNEYSGYTNTTESTSINTIWGNFDLPVCTNPKAQKVASSLIFNSFAIAGGYVVVSMCLAAVAIGINERLFELRSLDVFGSNNEESAGFDRRLLKTGLGTGKVLDSKVLELLGATEDFDDMKELLLKIWGNPDLIETRGGASNSNKNRESSDSIGLGKRRNSVLSDDARSIRTRHRLHSRPKLVTTKSAKNNNNNGSISPRGGRSGSASMMPSGNISARDIAVGSDFSAAIEVAANAENGGGVLSHTAPHMGTGSSFHSGQQGMNSASSLPKLEPPNPLLTEALEDLKRFEKKIRTHKKGLYSAIIMGLIIMDAVIQIAEQASHKGDTTGTLVLHAIIQTLLCIDLLLRFSKHPKEPWIFFDDKWNGIELVTAILLYTAMGLHDVKWLQFVRALRFVRLLRLFKYMSRLMNEVAVLIRAVGESFVALCLVVFLTFLYVVYFAFVGVLMFQAANPYYFGNVLKSMSTLVQVMTLDNWSDVMHKCMFGCRHYGFSPDINSSDKYNESCDLRKYSGNGVGWWGALYFIIFVVLSAMVLANLLVGVIISTLELLREGYNEEKLIWDRVRNLQVKYDVDAEQVEYMLSLFSLLDKNGNGFLTMDEMQAMMDMVRLSETNQFDLYLKVDADKSGQIDFSEFVEMIMLMRDMKSEARDERNARPTLHKMVSSIGRGLGAASNFTSMKGSQFGSLQRSQFGSLQRSVQNSVQASDGPSRDDKDVPGPFIQQSSDPRMSLRRTGSLKRPPLKIGGSDSRLVVARQPSMGGSHIEADMLRGRQALLEEEEEGPSSRIPGDKRSVRIKRSHRIIAGNTNAAPASAPDTAMENSALRTEQPVEVGLGASEHKDREDDQKEVERRKGSSIAIVPKDDGSLPLEVVTSSNHNAGARKSSKPQPPSEDPLLVEEPSLMLPSSSTAPVSAPRSAIERVNSRSREDVPFEGLFPAIAPVVHSGAQ